VFRVAFVAAVIKGSRVHHAANAAGIMLSFSQLTLRHGIAHLRFRERVECI
jgi:hypothetical protein